MREHHLEALLTLALTTGMRKGELSGLRWQDIDLENGNLYVRRTLLYIPHYGFKEAEPKTSKSRRKIVLSQFVIDVLRRHRTLQLEARLKAGLIWVDRDLVFCDKRGGFLQPMTLTRQFSRLLEEMGLPHIRFHDVRRFGDCKIALKGQKVRAITF